MSKSCCSSAGEAPMPQSTVSSLTGELDGSLKTLKNLRVGECGTVKKVHGEGALRRRIMDMGVTKGTDITVRKIAPLGDPIQISLRGYEMSLRKADAAYIEIA